MRVCKRIWILIILNSDLFLVRTPCRLQLRAQRFNDILALLMRRDGVRVNQPQLGPNLVRYAACCPAGGSCYSKRGNTCSELHRQFLCVPSAFSPFSEQSYSPPFITSLPLPVSLFLSRETSRVHNVVCSIAYTATHDANSHLRCKEGAPAQPSHSSVQMARSRWG